MTTDPVIAAIANRARPRPEGLFARPSVSVGVPVRNGGRFIALTLQSLLAQTFEDFELIISDNASDDETESVCREFAARDSRVVYYRHEQNIGLARNYNFLIKNARGQYFKWAAADDIHEAEYLRRCVDVLQQDDSVVLAYGKAAFIDEHGQRLNEVDPGFDLQNDSVCERLRYVIRSKHWVNAIFGLIRSEVLLKTPLMPDYPSGDYTILGELSLFGKFVEIQEPLFLRRLHPGASSQNVGDDNWLAQFWTGKNNAVDARMVLWRRSFGHAATIGRSNLGFAQKLSLAGSLVRTMITGRVRLASELKTALLCAFRP